MYKIQYSKKATINLAEIYAYIAEDNLFYAKDVVDHIKKSIEIVKQFPLLGTKQ